MPRTAGKYGRKPLDPERPALILEKYLDPRASLSRAGLPPVPLTEDVDRASEVVSWPMYCNGPSPDNPDFAPDGLGDCTIAGLGHMFGALATYGGYGEALFSTETIVKTYSAVGGYVPGDQATDQGCLMADVLDYARKHGVVDLHGKRHKVVGAARFGNPADEDLLGQVLDVTGTVYTGIQVQQSIEQEFADEEPWTYQPGEQFVGGHCIVLQRRRPAGSTSGVLEYVTWGALQPATTGFQAHCAEEAWFVVTEDFIRVNGTTVEGMDLQQLLSDMSDLG